MRDPWWRFPSCGSFISVHLAAAALVTGNFETTRRAQLSKTLNQGRQQLLIQLHRVGDCNHFTQSFLIMQDTTQSAHLRSGNSSFHAFNFQWLWKLWNPIQSRTTRCFWVTMRPPTAPWYHSRPYGVVPLSCQYFRDILMWKLCRLMWRRVRRIILAKTNPLQTAFSFSTAACTMTQSTWHEGTGKRIFQCLQERMMTRWWALCRLLRWRGRCRFNDCEIYLISLATQLHQHLQLHFEMRRL